MIDYTSDAVVEELGEVANSGSLFDYQEDTRDEMAKSRESRYKRWLV